MSEEKLPTLLELIKYYKEGTLSPEEKVFKYQSIHGPRHIHVEELQREVLMASMYGSIEKQRAVAGKK